jgi:hypothetical protein
MRSWRFASSRARVRRGVPRVRALWAMLAATSANLASPVRGGSSENRHLLSFARLGFRMMWAKQQRTLFVTRGK